MPFLDTAIISHQRYENLTSFLTNLGLHDSPFQRYEHLINLSSSVYHSFWHQTHKSYSSLFISLSSKENNQRSKHRKNNCSNLPFLPISLLLYFSYFDPKYKTFPPLHHRLIHKQATTPPQLQLYGVIDAGETVIRVS